jgi:DNA modification methylase
MAMEAKVPTGTKWRRKYSRQGTQRPLPVAYRTKRGRMLRGKIEEFLTSDAGLACRGNVKLIFTSPPYPLNRKKRYGNLQGEEYVSWLEKLAPRFRDLLRDDGSIVIEIGNSWNPGEPTMSTLALEALIRFQKSADLKLCQQFICHNPARLPSPAQWVTVDRVRVKDSFTHVWWLSPTARPDADNRRVLNGYSTSMKQLLKRQAYNAGKRPSQHNIGEASFLKNNGGAIPPNVLTFANTSSDHYLAHCKSLDLEPHPARMPIGLATFFVRFLTVQRNLVLDPFAGSNVTGAAAENLGRRWISVEPNAKYISGSKSRFDRVYKR